MTRARDRSAAASSLPLWAVLCFLCSGAAGLLYEVVWSKQLSYLLGGSLHAAATVVAAFLGGLALGARVLGAPLARRPRPARVYAALEVGVALTGLAILPLLRVLDGPVGQLYRAFGGESPAFAVARVVLLLFVLVPPAALMGATLPVLVARCERGALGANLAWLYAINTFGAVAGSVLGGFLLLPSLGLTATTVVAAGLNLIAALVAWRGSGSAQDDVSAPETTRAHVAPSLAARAQRAFAWLFAIGGFVALLLQLAWVRLFGLVFGSSVYSFSAVLGVYLLGIALGSALVARALARERVPAWGYSLLQLGLAVSAVAGLHAYAGLPRAMLELGERTGPSWSGLLLGEVGLVVPILIVPCVLLGAAFPLATRLLQRGSHSETTGTAYAINTAGTLVGSLATGFVLLPALGVQGVVILAAVLALVSGLVTLALPALVRADRRVFAIAGVFTLAAIGLGVTAPRWDPLLMSVGMFRPYSAHNLVESARAKGETGDLTRNLVAHQTALYYRDGINASVLVAADSSQGKVWMRVGGKVDAGTGDMLTQVLLGLLPAAFADSGARTLVVGHGSGVTAASALAAGAGPTDVVELEPAVVAGSRFFHEPAEDPLNDPRVTLHVEDARTLLAHGRGRYDVIISEPSNPWIAGVNNLFTVDFYRLVRARLQPDGVFCQWVQLYELSPTSFRSLVASYREVFPDAHLFTLPGDTDALLVAVPPGRTLSLERLRSPRVAFALERARLTAPEAIAAFYVGDGDKLREVAAGGTLNTDERPFVEYRAPRDMVEVGRAHGSHHPDITGGLVLSVVPPAGHPFAAWPHDAVVEWRARRRLGAADGGDDARVYDELRAADAEAVAVRLQQERAAAARGRAVADAQARLAGRDYVRAIAIARAALSQADGRERTELLLVLGIASYASQQSSEALAWFRQAQAHDPRDARPYEYEARILATNQDRAGARAVLERGLARLPGDPALTRARQALDDASR